MERDGIFYKMSVWEFIFMREGNGQGGTRSPLLAIEIFKFVVPPIWGRGLGLGGLIFQFFIYT